MTENTSILITIEPEALATLTRLDNNIMQLIEKIDKLQRLLLPDKPSYGYKQADIDLAKQAGCSIDDLFVAG